MAAASSCLLVSHRISHYTRSIRKSGHCCPGYNACAIGPYKSYRECYLNELIRPTCGWLFPIPQSCLQLYLCGLLNGRKCRLGRREPLNAQGQTNCQLGILLTKFLPPTNNIIDSVHNRFLVIWFLPTSVCFHRNYSDGREADPG